MKSDVASVQTNPTAASDPPVSALTQAELQHSRVTHGLARLVLAAFLFTFMTARVLVILIMANRLPPQLFFHVQGTHVHHLNYGIFILSITGACLLFARPSGHALSAMAIVYGIGLALTFDEFGMWLHLGGPYWQRASFDAVVIIAAFLTLIAFGSTIRHWRPRHRLTLVLLAVALMVFGFILYDSVTWAGDRIGPLLQQLEQHGPA